MSRSKRSRIFFPVRDKFLDHPVQSVGALVAKNLQNPPQLPKMKRLLSTFQDLVRIHLEDTSDKCAINTREIELMPRGHVLAKDVHDVVAHCYGFNELYDNMS